MTDTALARRHQLARQAGQLPGYAGPGRKTTRKNPRRPKVELPDWLLRFALPKQVLVSPGCKGFYKGFPNLTVLAGGYVEVTGQIKDHVIVEAARFVETVVPMQKRWGGKLTRQAQDAPTFGAPRERGDEDYVEFMVGQKVVVIAGASSRTIVCAL